MKSPGFTRGRRGVEWPGYAREERGYLLGCLLRGYLLGGLKPHVGFGRCLRSSQQGDGGEPSWWGG